MDGLTFTSNLIASLAWPIATIVIVALLRTPLAKLVVLLKRLKWNELEMDFTEEFEQLEVLAEAAKLPPASPPSVEPFKIVSTDIRTAMVELAMKAPSVAVRNAWRKLEFRLARAISKAGNKEQITGETMLKRAIELKLIDKDVADTVSYLRVMKNQAVRGPAHFDAAKALEFIDYADRVALALPEGLSIYDEPEEVKSARRAAPT